MKTDNEMKGIIPVAEGVWGMRHVFVNFYMVENEEDDNWVLVDAGLKWSAGKIKKMAESIFGADRKPMAIILTHGHFDHVGSVATLAEEWDVPVYAHYLEVPYLTGKSSYPPGDPTVGGGMMATLSFTYPTHPINIWNRINALPQDGTIPGMPEWRYLHTPGHSPGHISLFRQSDKVLIAGDAFVTTKAESALAIMMQTKVVSGPPKYLTIDWNAARESVSKLAALQPKIAATGHGQPIKGAQLRDELLELNQSFLQVAVPESGRYVYEPALADSNGIVYIPAEKDTKGINAIVFKAAAFAAVVAFAFFVRGTKKRKRVKQNEYLLDFEYNF